MQIKIGNLFNTIGLIIGAYVLYLWGANVTGVFWSAPLYFGGLAVAAAAIAGVLALIGAGSDQLDARALKLLDYVTYPGQVGALVVMVLNGLWHFKDSGFEYTLAFFSGLGVLFILLGNLSNVLSLVANSARSLDQFASEHL